MIDDTHLVNPTRYQLPQNVSPDRQRARLTTVGLNRARYPLSFDQGLEEIEEARLPPFTGPWPGISWIRKIMGAIVKFLPPKESFLSELPPESRFTWPKFFRHGTHAGSMKLRQAYLYLTNLDIWPCTPNAYDRLLSTIPAPRVKSFWEQDREFARQRLAGVNPMAIHRCYEPPNDALLKAANQVLSELYQTDFNRACEQGRVYQTEYPYLWEKPIQEQVRKGAFLASPTCLFYVDDSGTMMPLAIQLKPSEMDKSNPVFTPLHPVWDWRMARAHVQASDSHYHESISHLLDTHLVSEVFALATHRNLHPDHPFSQLITPHFEHTLAINEQARKNLLAKHGEIARCMAAKHTGNINLVRMKWASWDFNDNYLQADLDRRDVNDLSGFLYRDDSTVVHKAIETYARGILRIWYQSDQDVIDDVELQCWAREIASPQLGQVRGFPAQITSVEELVKIATSVIFRASAQHAAVNNGQFGAYGWVPNAPVAVYQKLPDELPANGKALFNEQDYYRALPNRARTFGQTGMVWLLSEPTFSSLLKAGEVPAFARDHCYAAYRVVARFRRQLQAISDSVDERNDEIGFEYNFLKPHNIGHSIAI